jgi:hypothetical protein
MSTTTLPSPLRGRLAVVARRIRWLRGVRGLSLLLLILLPTAAAAVLADILYDGLPIVARVGLLAAWLGLGTLTALLCLVLPLRRRLDPAALAALVEETYPQLGERLTSTVELTHAAGAHHGSPALIALLREETTAQSATLNFLRAVSGRFTRWLALAAAVVLLLAAAPALFWPRAYADHAQRFLMPWHDDTVPYSLSVTPGDTAVAQGRLLSLSVQVKPRHHRIALPQTCTLVITSPDGSVSRHAMPASAEARDTFTCTHKVSGTFQYLV